MKKSLNVTKVIIHLLILTVFSFIILGTSYIRIYFGNETIDEFIFYLANGATDGDMGIYLVAICMCAPFFVILMLLLISLFYNVLIDKNILLKFKNKSLKIYPVEVFRKHKVIGTLLVGVISLFIAFVNLNIFDYYKDATSKSTFIEDNYVMNSNLVTFNEKRNLIYIVVESLETSMFTTEQGGSWDYEVIPELYNLLQEEDSVSFSSSSAYGGMSEQYGAGWTTAALVSNFTGLPFKVPIQGNSYHSDNFMNGAYALGDMLRDNGYYNELISASRTGFGGIEEFFTKHGSYNIIDSDNIEKFNFTMNEADEGGWGFNDKYMFDIAKDRLLEISKNNQPFNLTMISIDTHPNDGYVGYYTTNKYDSQYENVYATDSELIYDFISWIKEQDFYDNTTIVIVGDHLNMQTEYFNNKKNRYIYNVIINSKLSTSRTKNRIFTSVDMYPTTISAIGGIINGEQLGLGVNLFSTKKTLAETYGLEEFNSNLKKRSSFYNTKILGSDFFELVVKSGSEEDGNAD